MHNEFEKDLAEGNVHGSFLSTMRRTTNTYATTMRSLEKGSFPLPHSRSVTHSFTTMVRKKYRPVLTRLLVSLARRIELHRVSSLLYHTSEK